MRLASYVKDGKSSFGAVIGDGVVDLGSRLGDYADLRALLSDGSGALGAAAKAVEGACPDAGLDDITFLMPIPRPEKIFCVGRNYRAYHEVIEDGGAPKFPSIFGRYVNSFVSHGQAIWKPEESDQLDYEGELAVVIGRTTRRISREDALSCVGGYTCLNEGSVRDWQGKGTQNCPGKNFYRSGSMGPWMVTADEIPDPSALTITTRISGDERQHSGTDMMIFDIPYVISHVSHFTQLEPGDIIATGSPGGSAIEMDSQKWMKAGDELEVEITGIGTLKNPVEAG